MVKRKPTRCCKGTAAHGPVGSRPRRAAGPTKRKGSSRIVSRGPYGGGLRKATEVLDVGVWFDRGRGLLAVRFANVPGCFRESAQDRVTGKMDMTGAGIGLSVVKVSTFRGGKPVVLALS